MPVNCCYPPNQHAQDCHSFSWENIQYPGRLAGSGKIPPTESGNSKQDSNIMTTYVSELVGRVQLFGHLPGQILLVILVHCGRLKAQGQGPADAPPTPGKRSEQSTI